MDEFFEILLFSGALDLSACDENSQSLKLEVEDEMDDEEEEDGLHFP